MTFLAHQHLPQLFEVLKQAGFQCVAPQVREGTIVYDILEECAQLPRGVSDQQAPGKYRLTQQDDNPRYFAWANGAEALKPMTFAPREILWKAERDVQGQLRFVESGLEFKPLAVFGVRPCDLAALHILDQHFAYNTYADKYYNARRRQMLLISVDCSHPAPTCFCASTGDGPNANSGFDIALTELDDGFLIRTKSSQGKELVEKLPTTEATTFQLSQADKQFEHAVASQTRTLPSHHLKDSLFANLEHPRWKEVGARCLSCGNCTSVCPTCFCHNEVEVAELDGKSSAHYRQWDSCFTLGHSYMHSEVLRKETHLRYRQWLTHKLGSWHDQYQRSGCVGCGRCITWCPVGIDITEEATAICGGNHP